MPVQHLEHFLIQCADATGTVKVELNFPSAEAKDVQAEVMASAL